MRISALNRKLLRDVYAMKGQATAIALVIGAGIAMFVAYRSNFSSLETARDSYYARTRFADVFVSARRAPERLADRLRLVPGVEDVETRVVADVVLDIDGLAEPATGRLVSIPTTGLPRLNQLYMRRGRMVARDRPDEVVASDAFVEAHGFEVGARIGAIINGHRRSLTIVGVAISPEYLFSIRPGEVVPDPKRFGVFWMGREALSSAFEMEGGFNDAVASMAPTAVPEAVADEFNRLLEPYGGRNAVLRTMQFSNWTLENELMQLRTFGFFVPLVFLFVAAFVLNIALTRALALQRPQLASLKALGYTNAELAWHYLKWGLVIALGGAISGVGFGLWMGTSMLGLYHEYFKFPELTFVLAPHVVLGAIAVALTAALGGSALAVFRAVRIAPAEAMRPESPARYRASTFEVAWLQRRLTVATRMVLRNLERQPVRAVATVVGIGFAGAILNVGFGLFSAMDALIATEFSLAQRQHMTVSLVRPASADAVYALTRLPGVLRVEAQRHVAVRISAGHRERTLAISALPATPDLVRPIGRDGRVVPPAAEGLVLSAILARALDVVPGQDVMVEVLEGDRTARPLTVTRLVDDIFGISAYMEAGALHRFVGEDATLTGAALLIDPRAEAALSDALKRVPAVAGVASKRVLLENFRRMMDENMGVMLSFNVFFAGVIAFGVVYNAARVSLSERSRELASLRVLGFTRAEISLILLGELSILTVAALPVGAGLGYLLTRLLIGTFESEIYRFPMVVSPAVMALAALTVVAAAAISGLAVRRRLDRLDLIGVLKSRE